MFQRHFPDCFGAVFRGCFESFLGRFRVVLGDYYDQFWDRTNEELCVYYDLFVVFLVFIELGIG